MRARCGELTGELSHLVPLCIIAILLCDQVATHSIAWLFSDVDACALERREVYAVEGRALSPVQHRTIDRGCSFLLIVTDKSSDNSVAECTHSRRKVRQPPATHHLLYAVSSTCDSHRCKVVLFESGQYTHGNVRLVVVEFWKLNSKLCMMRDGVM